MLRTVGRAFRHRPRSWLLGLSSFVAVVAGFWYGYGFWQWRAAQQAIAAGRWTEAQSGFESCARVWPRSVAVRLIAARAARLAGDVAAAEAHLNECLRLQKGATDSIQLEVLLLRVQLGEVDEVAPGLLLLVDNRHPESSVILETLAKSYMHNLRYRPALDCLDRWIEQAPEATRPHDWRGWVLERLNNPTEALKAYAHALELDPELVSVRLRVAEILLGKSNAPEALPHLERLYERHPERPDVQARLGQCRFQQGQFAAARKLLEAAAQKLPDDPPLLIHLAWLELQDANRPAKAEEYLRRVLKIDAADVEAQFSLSTALQLQGRAEEAAAALERYKTTRALLERANRQLQEEAEQPSRDPDAACQMGISLLAIGQERLGLYWLHQALNRAPAHQAAHQALAEFYDAKGERDRAAVHRRRLNGVQK